MLSVRPKVSKLIYRIYNRSIHPELFETLGQRTIKRANYTVDVGITSAGHFVQWKSKNKILTEVSSLNTQPLPVTHCLAAHSWGGRISRNAHYRLGDTYTADCHLEVIDPIIFWSLQCELIQDSHTEGMFHSFLSGSRADLGAISYIHVDSRSHSIFVQAFHTFPDDNVIVKSESSFSV
ncbi:MAG: DUF2617 family protein [Pirellulaceae bacterium]|nr:DUF2617 family protein [Pirellulaceae bacterium]